jgi:hypothetical protein
MLLPAALQFLRLPRETAVDLIRLWPPAPGMSTDPLDREVGVAPPEKTEGVQFELSLRR